MSIVKALASKLFISLGKHEFLTTVGAEDGKHLHALLTEEELTILCEAAFDMGVRSGMAAMQQVKLAHEQSSLQEVRRPPPISGLYRKVEEPENEAIELVRRRQ